MDAKNAVFCMKCHNSGTYTVSYADHHRGGDEDFCNCNIGKAARLAAEAKKEITDERG